MAEPGSGGHLWFASSDGRPVTKGHPRLALALSAFAVAVLPPGFLLVAPSSTWSKPLLLSAFAAIALVASFGPVVIRRSVLFDAVVAVALLALVFLGPLPAALIVMATDLVAWLFDRYRVTALLANVASFGWASIVVAVVLELAGTWPAHLAQPGDYVLLAAAWSSFLPVQFFVTRGLAGVVARGQSLRVTVRREFIDALPTHVIIVALGLLTAFLYTQIGILALALFAAIVLIPQFVLLPMLVRAYERAHERKPESLLAGLDLADRTALCAEAIADVMGLSRKQKNVIRDAATFLGDPRLSAPPEGMEQMDRSEVSEKTVDAIRFSLAFTKERYGGAVSHSKDFFDVKDALFSIHEHWGGNGWPGGLGGEWIPLSARVLAAAHTWAAFNERSLSHDEVLLHLRDRTGTQFDPQVVAAVARAIEEEKLALAGEGDFRPRLHRAPVPRLSRKAPRLAGLVAGGERSG